jgi:hypothetical protein
MSVPQEITLEYLRQKVPDELTKNIIVCVAEYKSGMVLQNAVEYISDCIKENDANAIQQRLTTLSAQGDYIRVVDNCLYMFNYDKYNINDIKYVLDEGIKDSGVAIGKDARKDLEDMMKKEESCVYLFMGDTGVDYFKELLKHRITNRRKTVVLFPYKKCFDTNLNQQYNNNLNTWKDFLWEDGVGKFFEFYIIHSRDYKYLFSSTLSKNIARFDYYEYNTARRVSTGYGRIHTGKNDTSFYDIIKQGYENAFFKRVSIRPSKNGIKLLPKLFSYLRIYMIQVIFCVVLVVAIVLYKLLPDKNLASYIFAVVTTIVNILQNCINKHLKGVLNFEG